MDSQVSCLRRFNRALTRRIGALDDRFMGRDRPMAESRMLFVLRNSTVTKYCVVFAPTPRGKTCRC